MFRDEYIVKKMQDVDANGFEPIKVSFYCFERKNCRLCNNCDNN